MTWHPVCPETRVHPERGVAALLDQTQVAVIRTFDGNLYAIDNIDPFTGAAVLSRGIVGTRGSVATIASPLHKQVFDLATGQCLDDPETCIPVYPIRVSGGAIEVRL